MITAIAAIALLSPANIADKTVVPRVPAAAVTTYDWKAQKSGRTIDSGSAFQTGSVVANNGTTTPEDWQGD